MNSEVVLSYTNAMVPADIGKSLPELVRIALYNIDRFDDIAMDGDVEKVGNSTFELSTKKTYRQRFEEGLAIIAIHHGWGHEACRGVALLKKSHPPDRIYRVRGGLYSATFGASPLGVIVSYRPGQSGAPAEAGVAILGFGNGQIGSVEEPLGVTADGLEDVTELARAGKLT